MNVHIYSHFQLINDFFVYLEFNEKIASLTCML